MNFLSSFFKKRASAPIARNRLQVLLAHERAFTGNNAEQSDLLEKLQREILEVIKRHIPIEQDKVQIKLAREAQCSVLEIDVEVPGITDKPDRTR